jgi:hypothetical protein
MQSSTKFIMAITTQQQSMPIVDVIAVNGEPMWRAIVSGKEYLDRSGQKLRQLVSHLTAPISAAATLETAQD